MTIIWAGCGDVMSIRTATSPLLVEDGIGNLEPRLRLAMGSRDERRKAQLSFYNHGTANSLTKINGNTI